MLHKLNLGNNEHFLRLLSKKKPKIEPAFAEVTTFVPYYSPKRTIFRF